VALVFAFKPLAKGERGPTHNRIINDVTIGVVNKDLCGTTDSKLNMNLVC